MRHKEQRLIPLSSESDELKSFGIDEAGRGCLAGPVVAALVVLKNPEDQAGKKLLSQLDDSKKLSPEKREELAPMIEELSLAHAYGLSWPLEIDRVNILNATFRAMSRALISLQNKVSQPFDLPLLYVDGNITIYKREWLACAELAPKLWHRNDFPMGLYPVNDEIKKRASKIELALAGNKTANKTLIYPKQKAIVRGDALVKSISAASILAKVKRDDIMEKIDDLVPGYEFTRHKGYATKVHIQKILEHGPSKVHRLSFLKKILGDKKNKQGKLF